MDRFISSQSFLSTSFCSYQKLLLPIPFLAKAYYFDVLSKKLYFGSGGSDFCYTLDQRKEYKYLFSRYSPLTFPLILQGFSVYSPTSKLFANTMSDCFIDPRFDLVLLKSEALSHNSLIYNELKYRRLKSLGVFDSTSPFSVLCREINAPYTFTCGFRPKKVHWSFMSRKWQTSFFRFKILPRSYFYAFANNNRQIGEKFRKFFRRYFSTENYLQWVTFYPKRKPFRRLMRTWNLRKPWVKSLLIKQPQRAACISFSRSFAKRYAKQISPFISFFIRSKKGKTKKLKPPLSNILTPLILLKWLHHNLSRLNIHLGYSEILSINNPFSLFFARYLLQSSLFKKNVYNFVYFSRPPKNSTFKMLCFYPIGRNTRRRFNKIRTHRTFASLKTFN